MPCPYDISSSTFRAKPTATLPETDGVDIASPDVYAAGVPYARFATLRRDAPVFWHTEPDGPGFWAITKHRDVMQVSKDAAVFSSECQGTQIVNLPRGDIRVSPDNLAVMDPPRHTQHRAIIAQSFVPSTLAKLEGYIGQLVTSLLDELVQRDRFEFMENFAAKLPMAIILEMVGVPREDEGLLKRWITDLLAPDDPEYRTSVDERAEITRQFMQYAHELAVKRREAPQDDLLSRLMAAEVEGVKLRYDEFGMFFMLLLGAGTHTSHLTLGNGVHALLQHPEQREMLARQPELGASTVEEVLRFCPPILHFRRTATRDTEVRGQRIAAGDKVVVWYASANRDEEVFSDPDSFDIRRSPNDHLAFGYGPHFCLGNALARMSTRIAFSECARRMPDLSLDGPPERLRSNWFNGFKRMPVRVGRLP
jgi:cytochrome P450